MESRWRWLSLAATLGWMEFILYLSSQSQPPVPPAPSGFPLTVVAHFGLYAMLAALVVRTSTLQWPARDGLRAVVLPAIALCLAWGGIDEFYQGFVPGRDSSVEDVATDVSGAIIGALSAFVTIGAWRRARAYLQDTKGHSQ
jgi:VanZ family protein